MFKNLQNNKKLKLKKLVLEFKKRKNKNQLLKPSTVVILKAIKRLYQELNFSFGKSEWNSWAYKGLLITGLLIASPSQAQESPAFETGILMQNTEGSDLYFGGAHAAPASADIDGDGDAEIVIGKRLMYESLNEDYDYVMTPEFEAFTDFDSDLNSIASEGNINTNGLTVADYDNPYSYAQPSFVDFDADGDQDLIAGDYHEGLAFLENDGTGNFTFNSFLEANNTVIEPGNFSHANFADIDNDGDMDMLVGERHGEGSYESQIHLYENTAGQGNPIVFENAGSVLQANGQNMGSNITGFHMPAPDLVDYDEDGDLDLFVGLNLGDVYYFENIGSATAHEFSEGQQLDLAYPDETFYGTSAKPLVKDMDEDGNLDLLLGIIENSGTSAVLYLFKGSESLGLEDEVLNTNFQIYPNPTNTLLNVHSSVAVSTLEVYSMEGQRLKTITNAKEISVNDLSAGIYFLKITDENGLSSTKKFLKK